MVSRGEQMADKHGILEPFLPLSPYTTKNLYHFTQRIYPSRVLDRYYYVHRSEVTGLLRRLKRRIFLKPTIWGSDVCRHFGQVAGEFFICSEILFLHNNKMLGNHRHHFSSFCIFVFVLLRTLTAVCKSPRILREEQRNLQSSSQVISQFCYANNISSPQKGCMDASNQNIILQLQNSSLLYHECVSNTKLSSHKQKELTAELGVSETYRDVHIFLGISSAAYCFSAFTSIFAAVKIIHLLLHARYAA